MAKHFESITKTALSEYISPDKFRTVMPPQWEFSGGYSELPVSIMLKKSTVDRLSFDVPWDGMVYGFVRNKFKLQEKLGVKNLPLLASLNDWENRFILVFEEENPKEIMAFEVATEEVITLLENCMRVPEQRSKLDKK